jgi:septal ring factor EnvC (AmiA/AmiB activator)
VSSAGLSAILVEENELVEVGGKIGRRGQGPVRFEIRREREHVDPMIWLDTDEL